MNPRERPVTPLCKSDEFCWPLGNYFENLLFLCSIVSGTDWCHLLCSPRTRHRSCTAAILLMAATACWHMNVKAALLLVMCAIHNVWVSLTSIQAIAGEIADIYGGQQWTIHRSSPKQKAMLQVARLQNSLPQKGDSYLPIATSHKLMLQGVSCEEVAEFPSTEKKEWERHWISHCHNNLFLLSVWCNSFTLATWNLCAL